MSSENWVEPFPPAESDGRVPERGVDTLLACGSNQPGDKQSQRDSDEDPGEHSGSPARRKTKEVTSQARVQVEAGRRCAGGTRESAVRGTESPDGGPGVSLEERCVSWGQRRSSPRAAGLLSYPERERDRRVEEPRGPGPFYFFGGANGAAIVTSYCESRGWQRIYDKTREDFKLKWCETRSTATYYNFKEGEQLIYQIPNNKVLTTKIGLLNSLREYDRVSRKVNHGRGLRRLRMEEFFPATFRMDVREERDAFFIQQEGECDEETSVWICKPTGLNQGRGIFLLRGKGDVSALRLKLQSLAESQGNRKLPFRLPQARVVQRYVQNPLLLKGRKFDVRSYFLIACTSPYMVFFRHGYVRLTCDLYDPNTNNLSAHLTNQYMQKKNPLYSLLKEETVWSMERFNAYVNEKLRVANSLPRDWVLGAFAKRMQQIVTQCFFAVKSKLERKLGYFDLIGCDFMIDEDFKVWLLEMNCNPALHTNCEVLKDVVPGTVVEALDLTLEIFHKCRSGLKIVPLANQKDFVLLYDGETPPVPAVTRPGKTAGPLRAQRPKSVSCQKPACKTQRVARQKSESGGKVDPVNPTSDVSRTVSETLLCTAGTPTPVTPTPVTPTAAPSTSPLPRTSSTSDDPSMMAAPAKPHPPPRASETPKASSRPPKPAKARVELRLSKCTWERRSGKPDRRKSPEPPWAKSGFASLSTPALAGGQVSVRRLGTTRAAPVSDHDPPFCCSLKPTQFPLARLGSGENEKGGASGGREPGEDTQSTAKEEEENCKL